MASSVKEKVVQVLLRHMRAKDTTLRDALRLAEMIALYKGIPDRASETPVMPNKPDPPDDVLGGLM